MDTDKIEFAKSSIEKSGGFTDDPLIEFVILWIGLNALYDDGTDREHEKLERFITSNQDIIFRILATHKERLSSFVDFVNNTPQHSTISDFVRTRRAFLKPQALNSVSDFQELIYKVRNNMFHSGKPWIQEEEAKLLKILNPVVKDMLSQITENYENDLRKRRVI